MPSKFAEFELPKGAEGLRTDKEGYAAMEQAGRRVGQLYGQAGSDYAAIGRLEDEAFRAQDFPLDFAAFSSGSTRSAGAGAGGGGEGFKVSGDINSFFSGGRGAPSGGGGGSGSSSRGASGERERGGGSGGSGRSSDDSRQADRSGRAAARFVDGWGNDISKEAGGPTVMRGGRHGSITGGDGNPKDVGQGTLTDPFSPDYRSGDERQSNWGYMPGAVQSSPLDGNLAGSPPAPGVFTPGGYTQDKEWIGPTSSAPPIGDMAKDQNYAPEPSAGGVGEYFSNMYRSVTSAVSSVGAAGIDSSMPQEGDDDR